MNQKILTLGLGRLLALWYICIRIVFVNDALTICENLEDLYSPILLDLLGQVVIQVAEYYGENQDLYKVAKDCNAFLQRNY